MKLLVVISSLDLRAPLGATPSLWQLLKALAEQGVELVVAPYQGAAIESLWWSAAENPCQREGDAVATVKRLLPKRPVTAVTGENGPGSAADRVTQLLVERVTKPRWRQHLTKLLETHRDFDAVLFLMVPPNHFGGIPRLIERRFGLPTYFYDGDVPASLPRFAGFRTGFRIYEGADLSEYAMVFSSSKGGIEDLKQLGARDARPLYYAADPSLFAHAPVDQDIDVFFYGLGREYREEWVDAMLQAPSRQLPEVRFAVRGKNLGSLERVRHLPYASFSKLSEYCARSRINLLITRQAHATVYASSTARPFELAALGCAMVSNPYLGIEEWFEPGREVLIVQSTQEAVEVYRELLGSPSLIQELGHRARLKVLGDHTYARRASELLEVIYQQSRRRPPGVAHSKA